MENNQTFWDKAMVGLSADSTDTGFAKQVAANVFAIRLADFNGDAKRARKAAQWLTGYDEDFWGNAYWEFRSRFGCAPSK